MFVNPYDLLGLTSDATHEQLKKAYRRLAVQQHPDKHGNSAESTIRFQNLTIAYQFLLDDGKRSAFDCGDVVFVCNDRGVLTPGDKKNTEDKPDWFIAKAATFSAPGELVSRLDFLHEPAFTPEVAKAFRPNSSGRHSLFDYFCSGFLKLIADPDQSALQALHDRIVCAVDGTIRLFYEHNVEQTLRLCFLNDCLPEFAYVAPYLDGFLPSQLIETQMHYLLTHLTDSLQSHSDLGKQFRINLLASLLSEPVTESGFHEQLRVLQTRWYDTEGPDVTLS